MIKVLIVDDEKPICDLIDMNLTAAGYHCRAVQDGVSALKMIEGESFDLILLDVMLPGVDGYDIMEYIRPLEVPVIFITAKHEVRDRVKGLRLGADDYLVKPFDFEELAARIRSIGRRPRRMEATEKLTFADISYEPVEARLTGPEDTCSLSRREGALMETFLRNIGQSLSRPILLYRVWGPDTDVEEGNLDNYIYFLRRRLKAVGSRVQLKTVRSIGYRMEDC